MTIGIWIPVVSETHPRAGGRPLDASPLTAFPEPRDLLEASAWVRSQPGLALTAARWFDEVPDLRAAAGRRALRLARPALTLDSAAALARTGGRLARLAPGRGGAVERAQRLVRAGGPAYVKLGQLIATAQGLLPREWVDAFAWCRDEVPPLAPGVAESIVHRAFGGVGRARLRSIDPVPMAAASIAQVHAATLNDGTEVVVKVRRPGLRERFERDIRAMAVASAVAERWAAPARMANLKGFVELFAQLVLEEIDFRFEALNMVELGLAVENAGHDHVTIPHPVPGLVDERVLVMERVPGLRYTDVDVSDGSGERLLRLAIEGILEQTLVYGIFHGDLHAGNVLIDDDGGFSLVDFGIVGRLDPGQRGALVRFMIGFAQDDIALQLSAMQMFGAIPTDADLDALVARLEDEVVANLPAEVRAGDASGAGDLAEALGTLLRLLGRAGFRVPKELVLFFKNLLYLNGFAAAVAPDIDLLTQIEPIFTYFAAKYPDQMKVLSG